MEHAGELLEARHARRRQIIVHQWHSDGIRLSPANGNGEGENERNPEQDERKGDETVVYVDNMRIPFGRMRMSHLMANTPEELREMAEKLGLTRYIQHPGAPKEHLDVSDSKRKEALGMGAVPTDGRKMVQIVQAKRETERDRRTEG